MMGQGPVRRKPGAWPSLECVSWISSPHSHQSVTSIVSVTVCFPPQNKCDIQSTMAICKCIWIVWNTSMYVPLNLVLLVTFKNCGLLYFSFWLLVTPPQPLRPNRMFQFHLRWTRRVNPYVKCEDVSIWKKCFHYTYATYRYMDTSDSLSTRQRRFYLFF